MSKRRRKQKKDPRRPRKEPGPSPDKAKILAQIASRFTATDSLHLEGDEGQADRPIGDAVTQIRQDELARIWRAHRLGDAATTGEADDDFGNPSEMTEDERERYIQTMEEHTEYHPYFDEPARLAPAGVTAEDGANPFAHVSLHVIIENQLAKDDPPQVPECIRRMEDAGLTRHEAVHHAMGAITELIHTIVSDQRPSTGSVYVDALERITNEVVEQQAKPE